MKTSLKPLDYILGLFWLVAYIAFIEGFGETGVLFYLIHTPPFFFMFPMCLYIGYKFIKKELPLFLLVIAFGIYVHLNIFSGRVVTFAVTPRITGTHNTPVRICSWNTAYFFKWGRDEGLSKLKEQECDFILLQEVWRSEELQEEITAIRDQYFNDFNFYSSTEFLIFSPKESLVNVTKSPTNGYFAIETTYKSKKLVLTSVHLWNPITDMPALQNGKMIVIQTKDARETQKKDLLAHLDTLQLHDTAAITVGDFNTLQNGEIIRDITKLKNNSYTFISTPLYKNKNTYSTNLRLIQIDYAYVDDAHKDNVSLKTACIPTASDHCLLIIDIML